MCHLKARRCFTVCASIWGDGKPGPIAISASAGVIPAKLRDEVNSKYPGRVYVLNGANCGSHFFTSESVMEMYGELYSAAFRQKRAELQLPPTTQALLLCDGFTGAHSGTGGFVERRLLWSQTNHITLPAAMPGGWSAKGQPCDALFGFYKSRVKIAMDISLGYGKSYFHAEHYESLPIGPTGWLVDKFDFLFLHGIQDCFAVPYGTCFVFSENPVSDVFLCPWQLSNV